MLTFALTLLVSSAPPVVLPAGAHTVTPRAELELLVDPTGARSFDAISSTTTPARFEPLKRRLPNLGSVDGAVWARLRLRSDSERRRRAYVRLDWPRLEQVDAWALNAGAMRHMRSGWMVPFEDRFYASPVHVFVVELPPGQERTIYLRMQSRFEMIFPIRVFSEEAWAFQDLIGWVVLGVLYGMISGLAIFALLVFARLRRRAYLYFAIAMFSFLSWWMLNSGWYGASRLLLDLGFTPLVLAAAIWMFFRAGFTRALLDLKTLSPRMDRVLRRVQYFGVPLIAVVELSDQGKFASLVGVLAPVLLLALELVAGLIALKRGKRLARWFLFGTGTLGGGLVLGVAIFSGVLLVRPEVSGGVILVGTLAELFGLAFALAESIREVTQEKEQALRQVEVERLGSLRALVAGVTHELNTPLGSLRSSADSLERVAQRLQGGGEALQERRAQKALNALPDLSGANRAATDRIEQVVRSLKMFAHLDESEEKVVDPHDGLESALVLLKPEIPHGVKIERTFDGPRSLRCRPAAINQVFMSVLENAVRAVGQAGIVRIQSRATDAGEGLSVLIIDDGPGIPKARMSTLFAPNLSARGARVKMGMGLSTAKSIIDDHGGRISIRSEEGVGTRVTIELPTS